MNDWSLTAVQLTIIFLFLFLKRIVFKEEKKNNNNNKIVREVKRESVVAAVSVEREREAACQQRNRLLEGEKRKNPDQKRERERSP